MLPSKRHFFEVYFVLLLAYLRGYTASRIMMLYMKRNFSYRQQTLFDMGFDDRGKEKLLMELPQNARLMMNGYEIIPSCNYLIDRDGNVYVSVPELDAAVLSENSVACDENGELLCFSVFDARRMKVITMESAMEQLEMGIG